jgi:hypothetical protein
MMWRSKVLDDGEIELGGKEVATYKLGRVSGVPAELGC